jgi:hypothetical protein
MPRGQTKRVTKRTQEVVEILRADGCVTTSALQAALGLNHSEAYHTLATLKKAGKAVEVVLGKTSIWCRDEEVARRAVEELKSEVRRLLCSNGRMRYATPSRVLELAESDRQAREVFSRYIRLDKTRLQSYKPPALAFADAVLRELFGEPQFWRHRERPVYLVTC